MRWRYLFSRSVTRQVFSAEMSLTSVFGMGTGGPIHLINNKKEPPTYWSEVFVLALLIFPGSRPPSIVSADELNFCVRDGNRWTLIAINTNSYGWLLTIFYISKTFRFLISW